MIGYSNKRDLIPEDKYLFSVTQVNEFFYNPNEFFRKVILKEEIPFANNATALGTLCHYAISQAHLDKTVTNEEVKEYLHSLVDFDINYDYVLSKFDEMKEFIIYNTTNQELNKPDEVEQNHILQLSENVYLGGTLDCRYGNKIIDYKTTSDKYVTEEKELPERYLNQLYAYSYMLHQKGIPVDIVEICYITIPETNRISEKTGKALKSYPCRYVRNSQYLKQENINDIKTKLDLISSTIEYILANPSSLGLFARDLNLRKNYGIK